MFKITVRNNEGSQVALKDLVSLRLTFALAATMIWGGLLLTLVWSSYFLLLPAIVGFGLTLSAITGVCPLSFVIEKLVIQPRHQDTTK